MKRIKAIIMGAAGRDFHNFNVYFRGNRRYKVVAFTAAQIPNIEGRKYKGIPIYPENAIAYLISKKGIEEAFFSYSDISYADLMNKAAAVMSCGASFSLLGPSRTMLKAKIPVIAVTAVRTGCGKSVISQKIADYLKEDGLKVGIVRHPMPYGNLNKQVCQKFKMLKDLEKQNCTIEEREEYEPYLEKGLMVYAGVDYERVLRLAEKENDIILWDGGNNDFPFYKPDLWFTLADAYRPNHEVSYYPGEINFRLADVIIISKITGENAKNAEIILSNAKKFNSRAEIIKARSKIVVDKPELIKGKSVLVVEDGPSVTHGGLLYGSGFAAALKYKAKKIIEPRVYSFGSIKKTFEEYPHLKKVLPAMGYGKKQMNELERIVNRISCDTVILATPARLEKFLKINKPFVSVRYELKEIGQPRLEKILSEFLRLHIYISTLSRKYVNAK